jgi:hypothetical protein
MMFISCCCDSLEAFHCLWCDAEQPTVRGPRTHLPVICNEIFVSPAGINENFSPADWSSSRAVSPLPQANKKRSRQDGSSPTSFEASSHDPRHESRSASSDTRRHKHHVTTGTPPRFHPVGQVGTQQPAAILVEPYSPAVYDQDSPVLH